MTAFHFHFHFIKFILYYAYILYVHSYFYVFERVCEWSNVPR